MDIIHYLVKVNLLDNAWVLIYPKLYKYISLSFYLSKGYILIFLLGMFILEILFLGIEYFISDKKSLTRPWSIHNISKSIYRGWTRSSIFRILFKRSMSTKSDIILYLCSILGISYIISCVLSFGIAFFVPKIIRDLFGYSLISSIDSKLIKFIIYWGVFDFLDYWRHRLSHTIPFWWQLHKYHHSAEEFNIITGNRVHPFDVGLDTLFKCIPLAIMGSTLDSYIVFTIIKKLNGAFQHSMVN